MSNPLEDLLKSFAAGVPVTVTQVVTCKACRQKNRVNIGKKKPRCGKCGLPLEVKR